jgi:hypothetical protein
MPFFTVISEFGFKLVRLCELHRLRSKQHAWHRHLSRLSTISLVESKTGLGGSQQKFGESIKGVVRAEANRHADVAALAENFVRFVVRAADRGVPFPFICVPLFIAG